MSRTCDCGTPESDLPEVTDPYEKDFDYRGATCSICREELYGDDEGTFLHCDSCYYDVCEECQ
jgi:hypothetical protein